MRSRGSCRTKHFAIAAISLLALALVLFREYSLLELQGLSHSKASQPSTEAGNTEVAQALASVQEMIIQVNSMLSQDLDAGRRRHEDIQFLRGLVSEASHIAKSENELRKHLDKKVQVAEETILTLQTKLNELQKQQDMKMLVAKEVPQLAYQLKKDEVAVTTTQSTPVKTLNRTREDYRCGPSWPILVRQKKVPAICDAKGEFPCCAETSGWCGNTKDHCACETCVDFREMSVSEENSGLWQACPSPLLAVHGPKAFVPGKQWRYDGRCGANFPQPNGEEAQCNPNDVHGRVCCHSTTGQCGSSVDHCPPPFGACNPEVCTDYRPKDLEPSKVVDELPKKCSSAAVNNEGQISSSGVSGLTVGNAMSDYWRARGVARLFNLGFRSTRGDTPTFTKWLRNNEEPAATGYKPNSTLIDSACTGCHGLNEGYSHNCIGLWNNIRPTIRLDTKMALQQAGGLRLACNSLRPKDTVIHSRCGRDPWFSHQYPFPAFSFYNHIPNETTRVLIVAGKPAKDEACIKMLDALKEYIRINKGIEVETLLGETDKTSIDVDYARLAFAPVLFRSSSSFSLWAALANPNDVFSPKNHITDPEFINAIDKSVDWQYTEVDLGADWHWIDVPQLTNEVKAKHNFDFDNPDPWVEWLRTH